MEAKEDIVLETVCADQMADVLEKDDADLNKHLTAPDLESLDLMKSVWEVPTLHPTASVIMVASVNQLTIVQQGALVWILTNHRRAAGQLMTHC